MSIGFNGGVTGELKLKSTGRMAAPEIIRFHPEIQAQLDDIVKQGWKYLYIETMATAEADLRLEESAYQIRASPGLGMRFAANARGLPEHVLELNIGANPPQIKSIPEVVEFRVNVCSKSFPRAATVDLAKGIVTYLHDPFWRWEEGWKEDKKKLSDAREVYEIATWLLDVKKFKLHEAFKMERYQELVNIFKALPIL